MKYMLIALYLIALLPASLFFSCSANNTESNDSNVTFFNESSYSVSIYQTSFSGPLLIDKLLPGSSVSLNIGPSDNYGSGSVFSIEYWRLVASGAEFSNGDDVWAKGIDPSMQISQNIELGKNYNIRIPQPENLEFQVAYIKILNNSTTPFEFNYLSNYYWQAGNRELSVPSGKTGIYELDDYSGFEIIDHTITQYKEYPFPELVAEKGYLYSFAFDGNSVTQTGEQNLVF